MKKVGLNAVMLTPQSGGILVYIKNLIDNLLILQSDIQLQLFFSQNFLKYYPQYVRLENSEGLRLSGEKPKIRIISEPFVWPRTIRRFQLDLFHSPISYIPFGVRIPAIVTIHDLGFFHFPEHYTKLRCKFLQKMIALAANKATKIIAISDYTKNDIIETFKINSDKLVRIYEGFDAERFKITYTEEQIQEIRNKYRLPEKYVLSVGHLEPRKNYLRLLKAFHQVREQEKIPHKLIIVGRENWLFTPFYELLDQLKLQEAVSFTGFVEQVDLPAVYQLADLFTLPTLFEGFGFPALESMAAGTAVVCSNATSLPEICKQAAVYYNPYDVDDMSDKLIQVLHNEHLKQSLIQKGFENIKRFSWERCAQQTMKVYQQI